MLHNSLTIQVYLHTTAAFLSFDVMTNIAIAYLNLFEKTFVHFVWILK